MTSAPNSPRSTTNAFAASLGVQGSTVRRSFCVRGHYMGIKPIKLANGRLLWPAEDHPDHPLNQVAGREA